MTSFLQSSDSREFHSLNLVNHAFHPYLVKATRAETTSNLVENQSTFCAASEDEKNNSCPCLKFTRGVSFPIENCVPVTGHFAISLGPGGGSAFETNAQSVNAIANKINFCHFRKFCVNMSFSNSFIG